MKLRIIWGAIMGLCIGMCFTACSVMPSAGLIPAEESATSSESNPQKISPEQALEMINLDSSVVIVDVRTSEEYREGHIPGAISIPNESIEDTMPAALPDLDADIIVYCRSGVRSEQAVEKLNSIGYTHLYDLGGILNWPYETVSG